MYILRFAQFQRENIIGAFKEEEDILEFIKKIPVLKEEVSEIEGKDYSYYFMEYDDLPVYQEISYNGYVYVLTKYAFLEDEEIEVYWTKLQNLSVKNHGGDKKLPGMTRVDAYIVDNKEVKEYILDREKVVEELEKYFAEKGYQTERDFAGSEDGEALCAYDDNGDMVTFVYLDPFAIEAYRKGELISLVEDAIENKESHV